MNLKDLTGVDALKKMYGEHTARYEFKMVVDGHEKIMNGTECRALRYHHVLWFVEMPWHCFKTV